MPIIEFFDKYPKYNMGFMASNEKTETEKLSGLRMHLLFSTHDGRTYQCFTIPEEYYQELEKRAEALTDDRWVVMSVNEADFYLKKIDGAILGICYQTKERVAVDKPIQVVIEPDKDEEWENYLDGLGGDWEG